jgi:tetratricopeptide (TPR) repeat protein
MKKCFKNSTVLLLFIVIGACDHDEFLNVLPEDVITSKTFWQTEDDAVFALNGIYSVLQSGILYGPEIDSWTPNGYTVFGSLMNQAIDATTTGAVVSRWTSCYAMISRTNYFLDNIDRVERLAAESKARYVGEAHFLRGLAYLMLADTYGGVPLITSTIGVKEARELSRASAEETWSQVISDLDVAAENLPRDASQPGRATKGAALGMQMRAYLYQGKYEEILSVVDQIDALNKYSLFPSYEGLFLRANENNQEVIFDIQHIGGPNEQGAGANFVYLLPSFSGPGGGLTVPTQDIVDAFEMADGSPIDPANPYEGRDPRLYFSVILEGTQIGDHIFNVDVFSHTQQAIKHLAIRKFSDILVGGALPPLEEADLNFIVMRYAEVLLSKAEALIELNRNIDEAIALINRIRTEREDVKISPLPMGLSQSEAREALRRERRVEFAFEGLYWSDIRRWGIGPDVYPMNVYGTDGSIIERRYIQGFQIPRDNLFPIPDSERSLNDNLTQNPGY